MKSKYRSESRSHPADRLHVVCFAAVLILFGILAAVLPKPTYSEVEKRELAPKPSFSAENLFSSRYTTEFTAFFADTFPFREEFIALAGRVEELRGLRPDNAKIYDSQAAKPAPSQKAEAPEVLPETDDLQDNPSQETAPPPAQDASGYLLENGIFVVEDRAINLFGGDAAAGTSYAQVISSYLEDLDPSVRIYNMVVPTSSEFYLPPCYAGTSQSQKQAIDHIYGEMDPRVTTVDAYSALAQHTDEYIYFRTDHHWTALGAYYAYTAFCEAAGLEPVPLEQMEQHTREGYLGTFYGQTGDPVLAEHPDDVTWYVPPTGYKAYMRLKDQPYTDYPMRTIWEDRASMVNSYSIFLSGDLPFETIVTEHKNGRKIVVVKESYANAFVPFLISDFEEIYVVDQRYFQTSLLDMMEEKGATDILFLNNSFAAHTPYHIRCINNLKRQVWTPPPEEPEEDGVLIIEEDE